MFDEITQFTGDHESQIKQSNGIIEKISQSVDFVGFTFTYYHTISALGLIQVNIIVSFKYDPALSKFDITVNSNHNIVRTIVEDIQKITIANNIVLMQ